MTQIANITVKKNDGTTDIVWTGISPSGGDRSPSVWQSLTVGSAMSHRPALQLSCRDNGNGTARRFQIDYQYPQTATNTTTGVTSIVNRSVFSGSMVCPKDMDATTLAEAVSQFCHLLASAHLKDVLKSGYAAT